MRETKLFITCIRRRCLACLIEVPYSSFTFDCYFRITWYVKNVFKQVTLATIGFSPALKELGICFVIVSDRTTNHFGMMI